MSITVTVSPTQLSWSDFAPVDSLPEGEDAQTATSMPANPSIDLVSTHGKYSISNLTLNVGLDRTKTLLVRTANKTTELLKHEQGHFDMMVLVVRVMAKEWERLEAHSPHSLDHLLKVSLAKHQHRANALGKKYDKETNHSRNIEAQKSWNQAIDAAMKGNGTSILKGMHL